MSKITAFLKQNKKQESTHELTLESFDAPIIIRIISGKENKRIQKNSMVDVKQGRQTRKQLDAPTYNEKLAIASIVSPPLTDKELQDSYGAMGESDLYNEMFNFAEQNLISEFIMEISGFNQDINAKTEEAENL